MGRIADFVGKHVSPQVAKTVEHVVDAFSVEVGWDAFTEQGLCLQDLQSRTVGFYQTSDLGYVKGEINPFTDVVVCIDSVTGFVLGWVSSSEVTVLGPGFAVKPRQLCKMPSEWLFAPDCAHMAEHGGVFSDAGWLCFGCDRQVLVA